MSTADIEGDRQVLPFATSLRQIDDGAAADRASRLLNELVTAVADTGRKGTLTLTVTVEPYKKSDGRILDVTCKTVTKLPEPDDATASGVFFHQQGNLRRDDPDQPTLPLRDVTDAA